MDIFSQATDDGIATLFDRLKSVTPAIGLAAVMCWTFAATLLHECSDDRQNPGWFTEGFDEGAA
jgi:hypothetical protein